jgi:hypothetical protein
MAVGSQDLHHTRPTTTEILVGGVTWDTGAGHNAVREPESGRTHGSLEPPVAGSSTAPASGRRLGPAPAAAESRTVTGFVTRARPRARVRSRRKSRTRAAQATGETGRGRRRVKFYRAQASRWLMRSRPLQAEGSHAWKPRGVRAPSTTETRPPPWKRNRARGRCRTPLCRSPWKIRAGLVVQTTTTKMAWPPTNRRRN